MHRLFMKYVSEMTFVRVIVGLFKSCAFDKHLFTYPPTQFVCMCVFPQLNVCSTQGFHIDEALLEQFGIGWGAAAMPPSTVLSE